MFFANWKKVEQNNGIYKIEQNKNFDLKPYSINDSALFVDYNDNEIKANSDLSNRFILSTKNDITIYEKKDQEIKEAEKETLEEKDKIEVENKQKNEAEFVNMSLSDLLKLLDKINKKLSSGEKITQEDIDLSKKILSEVRKRKGKKSE